MASTIPNKRTRGTAGEGVPHAALRDDGRAMAARVTTEQVWHQVVKASFAILSYVTPAGQPRSSGVVYTSLAERLYVAVAPDSWKARHIAAKGRVAVTVPVRRGGLLSLVAPIPPATISFHAAAIVHPAGSPQARSRLKELGSLVPVERRASACIIEVVPEGESSPDAGSPTSRRTHPSPRTPSSGSARSPRPSRCS
jgi:Pyridoxamine 5'-phosphate oxidase